MQGCADPLQRLLDEIGFDPATDEIWFTGDLVNRGPKSLKTLRLVKALGSSAITVLGNHDLHLLAVAEGIRGIRQGDTVKKILNASDSDELLDWVRHLPMTHVDKKIKTVMVHAGVYPSWGVKKLQRRSAEVEGVLRSDQFKEFLFAMYGQAPTKWKKELCGMDRFRFITNALTRMRFVTRSGHLDLEAKGPPGSQSKKLIPWYQHPSRQCDNWRIIFGHWSALGFVRRTNVVGLDSGCVWGGALTAVRLDKLAEIAPTRINCAK